MRIQTLQKHIKHTSDIGRNTKKWVYITNGCCVNAHYNYDINAIALTQKVAASEKNETATLKTDFKIEKTNWKYWLFN